MSPFPNPHRGEAAVEIDGESLLLVYDWPAIVRLQEAFGADFDQRIGAALEDTDLAAMAQALEIGLAKHQPGRWSAAAIMDASPPITPTGEAIGLALRRAFHGTEAPGEVGPVNPTCARWGTLSSLLSRWRLKRG